MSTLIIDDKAVAELETKYDSEMRFRPMVNVALKAVTFLLIALSAFHYYTAGFGLLREATHRGVHLAFVLALIFLVFAFSKKEGVQREPSWHHPLGLLFNPWNSHSSRCTRCPGHHLHLHQGPQRSIRHS